MASALRRHAMAATAALVTAPAVVYAAGTRDVVAAVVAAALVLWTAVELSIARLRSFEGATPASRMVKAGRMLWLASGVFACLDVRLGWTRVALPLPVALGASGLALGGVALRGWAVAHLGRSFSYDVKRPAGGVLVRSGPYRLVRHPAYLGLALVSTLPALAVGSAGGFAGLAAATVVTTVLRVRAEDEVLEREFGDEFRAWARRTARLVPFVY